MTFLMRHIPDALAAALGLLVLLLTGYWMLRRPLVRSNRVWRWLLLAVMAGVGLLIFMGFAFRAAPVSRHFPPSVVTWTGTAALMLIFGLVLVSWVLLIGWIIPKPPVTHNRGRRAFLNATRGAVCGAPIAMAGYAVLIQRGNITGREIDLPIPNLPKELHGLRLAQLSDIHLSPFLSVKELARAVDLANEFRPHLTLVTGDLITSADDPLDACIAQLGRLRADAGVLGCHGNHEVYANAEDYTTEQCRRLGIEFLRSESKILTFGGKSINFAGVDYQPMKAPYLVGAGKMVQSGMPNILLSHNPDVFPLAAELGFEGTLSGHTHGGQITMEILNQNLSMARFYTPYVYGIYRSGNSSIYVTRGIGTVGIPARFGAQPEVALIRLCAI